MATMKTLHELFITELRDACDAERQLTKALPRLAKAASSEAIRGKHCEGMAGLVDEGRSLLEENFNQSTTDAGLIAAALA